MKSQVLTTPIDEIATYLKNHPNSTTSQIAMLFKVNESVVDKWVSILEEEKVVKVEFHGFEPEISFIEVNKEKKGVSINNLKDAFVKACYKKNVSNEKMKELWRVFFIQFEDEIKSQFEKESIDKKMNKKMLPIAWKRFRRAMEEL